LFGETVIPYLAAHNGGIKQFRDDVHFYYQQGYQIFAKGSKTEAIALADLGCSTEITIASRNNVVAGLGLPAVGKFVGIKSSWRVEPCFRGPEGLRSPPEVFELLGQSYDTIKKYYYDRYNIEHLLSIFETGYASLEHHPLAEVLTFAHHILWNRHFFVCYGDFRSPKHASAYLKTVTSLGKRNGAMGFSINVERGSGPNRDILRGNIDVEQI